MKSPSILCRIILQSALLAKSALTICFFMNFPTPYPLHPAPSLLDCQNFLQFDSLEQSMKGSSSGHGPHDIK